MMYVIYHCLIYWGLVAVLGSCNGSCNSILFTVTDTIVAAVVLSIIFGGVQMLVAWLPIHFRDSTDR